MEKNIYKKDYKGVRVYDRGCWKENGPGEGKEGFSGYDNPLSGSPSNRVKPGNLTDH